MNAIPVSLQSHDESAADPSMEEILASIRRIIADDQAGIAAPPAPPARARAEPLRATIMPQSRQDAPPKQEPRRGPPAPTIFQADEPASRREPRPAAPGRAAYEPPRPVAPPAPPARAYDRPSPRPPAPARPAYDFEPPPAETRAPVMEQPAAEAPHAPESARLPEPVRVAAPGPAAQEPALLSANADASVASSFQALAESVVLQDSAILGDAVREMLRPMLKQWLDDNLPVLVERLVRAEIERVARGGR